MSSPYILYGGKKLPFNTDLKNNAVVLSESKLFASLNPVEDYSKLIGPLPKAFDGRDIWKFFLSPIEDQKDCGACYSFSWASTFSDRLALLTLNKIHVQITAVDPVICQLINPDLNILLLGPQKGTHTILGEDQKNFNKEEIKAHTERGCQGNSLYNTAKFLYLVGASITSCIPNHLIETDIIPTCQSIEDPYHLQTFDWCVDHKTAQRVFRLNNVYTLALNSSHDVAEKQIMYEIYKWGPIVSGFLIYDDFSQFDGSGIYTHSNRHGKLLGGHAVSILGWGEETIDGRLVKYWIIRNSWGVNWGNSGFFRMERWLPDCQLEQNIVCGIPELPNTLSLRLPSTVITPVERSLLKYFAIDPTRFYAETSIKQIQKGIQKGDLRPLISVKELPAAKTFVAGKARPAVITSRINNLPYFGSSRSDDKWIKWKIILIVGLAICILYLLWKLLIQSK